MLKRVLSLIFLFHFVAVSAEQTKESSVNEVKQKESVDNSGLTAIKLRLYDLMPSITPDSIKLTPVAGLYEVFYGTEIIYITIDGRYMLRGELVDLETRENLTEVTLSTLRKKMIAKISDDDMIIFSPPEYKHSVTIFTDIDCGYCRKLHSEMVNYHKNKIRVKYLMYPRAGRASESYKKAVSVMCSEDPKKALTDAKNGKLPKEKTCANPVSEHMKLANLLGVRGTPNIVLDSGRLLPGYFSAEKLSVYLKSEKN